MGKIFWIIIIFLIVGGYMIKMNNDLNLSDKPDQITFVKIFFNWIKGVSKSTVNTVGYVTKQDWMPPKINDTNSTK